MIKQCAIIFGCLALGELVVSLTGMAFPSSIIGMLLLTLLLRLKVVKLGWVKGFADFLSANIAFFFVPAGVAVMLYTGLLKQFLWPVVVAAAASTVLTLLTTGWVHQGLRKSFKQRKADGDEGISE